MKNARDGLIRSGDRRWRCFWAGSEGIYLRYHDTEWGFPVDADQRLFEKLCLEGFQAGLSWLTILKKREAFRRAFAGFDFEKVARFGRRQVGQLLQNAGIVRHRGKIESTVNNARRACELADEVGSLAAYFWRFEPLPSSRPRRLTRAALMKLTASQESQALARDLKRRGFSFVGPTTVYAFMQAMGLINDHAEGCAFRDRAAEARITFTRPA